MAEAWNRTHYSAENCTIGRTLDIVGDKWTIPILRECFLGVSRFSDIERLLGCARNLLSQRLVALVEAGLLSKSDYQVSGQRRRPEYHLTAKGNELLPVLIALMQWGDRWTADDAGPPLNLLHRDCGGRLDVSIRCANGHTDIASKDVVVAAGPGAIRT